MATDVEVQFFSHLNGLTLGNNWGDLIRLLDKALVTGINFTEVTSASINEQGDVIINLYAAHNAMLFQIVELSGFAPSSMNQKYRIKGVPSATRLVLKPKNDISERAVATRGAGKLASLGYEIVFRDTNDVKRVYRAKNPTAQHPFIRIDETISDGANNYDSNYAKYAMVGLLESMSHIDDYYNPDVLQLPFDLSNPAKNWKISGTGTSVVRGWSRWYYARSNAVSSNTILDTAVPTSAIDRPFSIVGDQDAFYLNMQDGTFANNAYTRVVRGCGLIKSALLSDIVPNWFLMSSLNTNSASTGLLYQNAGDRPLVGSQTLSSMYMPTYSLNELKAHTIARPVMPDYLSGNSGLYKSSLALLEIPVSDTEFFLRGSLMHVYYSGTIDATITDQSLTLSENSMYLFSRCSMSNAVYGALGFYLGDLE